MIEGGKGFKFCGDRLLLLSNYVGDAPLISSILYHTSPIIDGVATLGSLLDLVCWLSPALEHVISTIGDTAAVTTTLQITERNM